MFVGWPMSTLANFEMMFKNVDSSISSQIAFNIGAFFANKITLLAASFGLFFTTVITAVVVAYVYPLVRLTHVISKWLYSIWLTIGVIAVYNGFYPYYPNRLSVFETIDDKLTEAVKGYLLSSNLPADKWMATYNYYSGLLVPLHFVSLFALLSAIGAITWGFLSIKSVKISTLTLPGDARVLLILCSLVTSLFLIILSASQETYLYGFTPTESALAGGGAEQIRVECEAQKLLENQLPTRAISRFSDVTACSKERIVLNIRTDLQYLATSQSLQSSIVFTVPIIFVAIIVIVVSTRAERARTGLTKRPRGIFQSAIIPVYVALGFRTLSIIVTILVARSGGP